MTLTSITNKTNDDHFWPARQCGSCLRSYELHIYFMLENGSFIINLIFCVTRELSNCGIP